MGHPRVTSLKRSEKLIKNISQTFMEGELEHGTGICHIRAGKTRIRKPIEHR
jgi:hypothetical protein